MRQYFRDDGSERTWLRCMHCRRELTNPRSRAIGLGTTCVEQVPQSMVPELTRAAERKQAAALDAEEWKRQRDEERAEKFRRMLAEVPAGEDPDAYRARKALADDARARMRALREHGRGS